jgi:p-aminobenzoyl-glutamate transporter AbgT
VKRFRNQACLKGIKVMRKRNIFIRFLLLLAVIAVIAAWTSIRTHESADEYFDDSVITAKVKSLLAADDFLKSFQVSVKTYHGSIQLSGLVNSQKAINKADEIVKSIKGVTDTKNNLIVKQVKEKYHEIQQ